MQFNVCELSPYNNFLLKLSKDIDSAGLMADTLLAKYQSPRNAGFLLSLNKLSREINSLKYTHLELMAQFANYHLLKSRQKRSLFPFLGGFFHSIFGLLSDADINSLKQNIANLAKNQADICHVIEESLTIINSSRISIDRNRQTINDILTSMTDMDNKFANITDALELGLTELSQFTQIYLQLDIVVEELKRFMLKGLFLVEHLKVKLSVMSLSRLSTSLVDPFELKQILNDIQHRFLPNLKLPSNPNDGLWTYYNSLKVTTFVEQDQIVVIILLPLMQYDHQFEIYEIKNLPIPLINDTIKTSDTHAMVARFDLESAGLVMNIQRTKCVLPSSQQLRNALDLWLEHVTLNRLYFLST